VGEDHLYGPFFWTKIGSLIAGIAIRLIARQFVLLARLRKPARDARDQPQRQVGGASGGLSKKGAMVAENDRGSILFFASHCDRLALRGIHGEKCGAAASLCDGRAAFDTTGGKRRGTPETIGAPG
jgi:hypothetical protein